MFTGIVEQMGTLVELKPMAGGYRLRVEAALAADVQPGDSVAVNGVCLTALVAHRSELHADIGPETARITTIGAMTRGAAVNLERPLRADGRVGGHFVLGHVDGVGTVDDVRAEGGSHWVTVTYPPSLAALFIRKGSVAVDGVSLTVAGLDDRHFDVQVIPYTWSHTTLGRLRPGDKVNLECDVLGKYVARASELATLPDRRRH
ncbi:MAG: riboflavin synthase [Vicinamibacterales bacterium]